MTVCLGREDGASRPRVNNLEFDSISVKEASWLERPFNEAEVVVALVSLNGDNAPGPDGMSLAFFQHFWGVVRLERGSAGNVSSFLEIQGVRMLPLWL